MGDYQVEAGLVKIANAIRYAADRYYDAQKLQVDTVNGMLENEKPAASEFEHSSSDWRKARREMLDKIERQLDEVSEGGTKFVTFDGDSIVSLDEYRISKGQDWQPYDPDNAPYVPDIDD